MCFYLKKKDTKKPKTLQNGKPNQPTHLEKEGDRNNSLQILSVSSGDDTEINKYHHKNVMKYEKKER